MSRTIRKLRPRMTRHALPEWFVDKGVRDGTPQFVSSGCERHGDCDWCKGSRLFGNKKREPVTEGVEYQ